MLARLNRELTCLNDVDTSCCSYRDCVVAGSEMDDQGSSPGVIKGDVKRFKVKQGESAACQSMTAGLISMFQGILMTVLTCSRCNTIHCKEEPFLDLSLDLGESSHRTLYDAMDSFVGVEHLQHGADVACNECGAIGTMTREFRIKKLPNILCVHFKRFRWNGNVRTKITDHVEFPLDALDMSAYTIDGTDATYELSAVVEHVGDGYA